MKKTIYILLVFFSWMLQSCDAVLILTYQVKNHSRKPVKIKIEDYNNHLFDNRGVDTIVILNPGKSFIVGRSLPDIGFPGDEVLIYNKYPSCNNFSILKGDSVIAVNPTDKEWKYGSGYSTYKITNRNLPYNY